MRRIRPLTQVSLIHRLTLEHRRHGGVHHQLRQPHRALVQRVNGCADGLIFIPTLHLVQRSFQLGNPLLLVAGKLPPGGTFPAFFKRGQNRACLITRLNPLPLNQRSRESCSRLARQSGRSWAGLGSPIPCHCAAREPKPAECHSHQSGTSPPRAVFPRASAESPSAQSAPASGNPSPVPARPAARGSQHSSAHPPAWCSAASPT